MCVLHLFSMLVETLVFITPNNVSLYLFYNSASSAVFLVKAETGIMSAQRKIFQATCPANQQFKRIWLELRGFTLQEAALSSKDGSGICCGHCKVRTLDKTPEQDCIPQSGAEGAAWGGRLAGVPAPLSPGLTVQSAWPWTQLFHLSNVGVWVR